MATKTRPIKDLYFRFIQGTEFEGVLNAQQVADALCGEGLIEIVPHNSQPIFEHYRDIAVMDFNQAEIYDKLMTIFERYANDQGLV